MIHYHGTPCGMKQMEAEQFLKGRHAFISFAAPCDIRIAAEVCSSFAIDNGAFSAWKKNEPIQNWQPYYGFVEYWRLHPGFDWAIIPDVIDGSEEDNDRMLSEWPFRSPVGVPVWHLHESLGRLRMLVHDPRFPRIALGSSGHYRKLRTRKWKERMAQAMEVICELGGRPLKKVHGLRMLDAKVFSRYPLASADSTNAVRNASLDDRFGMYLPYRKSTRAHTIAERIERHNSAPLWIPPKKQLALPGCDEAA